MRVDFQVLYCVMNVFTVPYTTMQMKYLPYQNMLMTQGYNITRLELISAECCSRKIQMPCTVSYAALHCGGKLPHHRGWSINVQSTKTDNVLCSYKICPLILQLFWYWVWHTEVFSVRERHPQSSVQQNQKCKDLLSLSGHNILKLKIFINKPLSLERK